jgi:hypothetical protein
LGQGQGWLRADAGPFGFVLPKCDISGREFNESPLAALNKKIEKQPHAK